MYRLHPYHVPASQLTAKLSLQATSIWRIVLMSVSCTTGWASFSEGYAGSGRGGMVSAEEVADHPYDYADTFIRNTMVFT